MVGFQARQLLEFRGRRDLNAGLIRIRLDGESQRDFFAVAWAADHGLGLTDTPDTQCQFLQLTRIDEDLPRLDRLSDASLEQSDASHRAVGFISVAKAASPVPNRISGQPGDKVETTISPGMF